MKKCRKRILSFMLAFVLVLSQFAGVHAVSAEENPENGLVLADDGELSDSEKEISDRDRAEAVAEAVEEAMQSVKMSNDTTEESFMAEFYRVLEEVLAQEGISSEKVQTKLKQFMKSEADQQRDGDIIAIVDIQVGEGSCEAKIAVPIARIMYGYCGAADNEGGKESVTWRIAGKKDNYTLTISGSGKMEDYRGSNPWSAGVYKDIVVTEIVVEEGVTSVGNYAFHNFKAYDNNYDGADLTKVSKVSLPESLTRIGTFSFCYLAAVSEINLPECLTEIGSYAFEGLTGLCRIDLPEGLATLGDGVFRETALQEVTLPSSLTAMGMRVFFGSSLKTIHAEALGAPFVLDASSLVIDKDGEVKLDIYVKPGLVSAFQNAEVWKDHNIIGTEMTDAEKVAAVKTALETVLANISVSNTTTKESLEEAIKAALTEAGVNSEKVNLAVEDFARTDATKDTEGSVTAKIKLTCGETSDEAEVNKIIAKLPQTADDKVKAAKEAVEAEVKSAVEKLLDGIQVTEDNAEEIKAKIAEVLPDVIAEALTGAGLGSDDVTIGDINILLKPAASDSEGSIDISIPFTDKEDNTQSDTAAIHIPLAKTGGDNEPDKDAEKAEDMIKDALAQITITNETTKEDILNALKTALGDNVTVEDIEEFVKVDATQDAPGSLSLRIKIIINGKTIIINITVPIEKLNSRTGVYVRFLDYYELGGDSKPCYKYTGAAIKPVVEVYNNETLLRAGTDYTLSYKNNTKVGNGALTVKGKGNFSGTSNVVNFTIINADINADTDHPAKMTVTTNTKVAPIIMNGTKKLTTKDYELTGTGLEKGKYSTATAAGAPNILTVKGIGNYAGSSFEIEVTVIEKSAAKKLAVTVDKNFKPVYDGSALDLTALFVSESNPNGAITVTDSKEKTKVLKEGTDFTVVCTSSLVKAGTVKFTVTGMGEYTGSVNKTFKINPLKAADSSKFQVTFDDKVYEYKASGATVDNLVVKYLGETDSAEDDKVLTQGADYKIAYSNNKKVSGSKDAGIKITFLGNYKGSAAVTKTFKVASAKLSGGSTGNTAVTIPDKVYTKANKAYKSAPIVTVDGAVIKASNYSVSYKWATESKAANDADYVSDDKVKITIADGDNYAKVKVTITPKGSYALAEGAVIEGAYYVRKAAGAIDLSKAKVTFHDKAGNQLKKLEYNGRAFYTPEGNNPGAENAPGDANAVYVKVTVNSVAVDPGLYHVTWTNATAKGKATVVIRGTGITTPQGTAVGSRNQSISITAMVLKGRNLGTFMERATKNLKHMLFKIR